MLYRDSDSTKPREVKDIHDFPTSFLANLERVERKGLTFTEGLWCRR